MIFWSLLACMSTNKNTAENIVEDSNAIVGILITPDQSILSVGQELQLKATAITASHSAFDVTESVEWMIEYFEILNISEDLDSEGLLTASAEGTSRIYAQYNDIQSPFSDIIVTGATLTEISIEPSEVLLSEGHQLQMKALGSFSDGTVGVITQQVRWITDNSNIVQFQENGILIANGVGTSQVQAKLDRLESPLIDVQVSPFVENGKADLVFESISIDWTGDTPYLDAILVNQGSIGAEDFWVDLYYQDNEPYISQIGDQYDHINYLGSNQGLGLHFELDLLESGTIWIFADSGDYINESHENNNTAEYYY